ILVPIFYSLWGWISVYFYNNTNDGFIERSPTFLACLLVFFLSRKRKWALCKTRFYLNLILWGITIHFFYILGTNPPTLLTTVGTEVHIVGVCSAMISRKELGSYILFVMFSSYFVFRSIPNFDWSLMWGLMLATCAYFFLGAHFRTLFLDLATSEHEKSI